MNLRLGMKIFVNILTTSRLFASLFLLFFIDKIPKTTFLIIVVTFFLTDSLDGILARKYKVQTLFGSIMDTVADKALSIVLLIPLLKHLPTMGLLLIGEVLIASSNLFARAKGKITKASYAGKVKMWVLSIAILIGYLVNFSYLPIWLGIIASVLTFLLQCYVLVTYVISLRKQKSVEHSKETLSLKKCLTRLFDTDEYLKMMGKKER